MSNSTMSRRRFLRGATALAASLAAGTASASTELRPPLPEGANPEYYFWVDGYFGQPGKWVRYSDETIELIELVKLADGEPEPLPGELVLEQAALPDPEPILPPEPVQQQPKPAVSAQAPASSPVPKARPNGFSRVVQAALARNKSKPAPVTQRRVAAPAVSDSGRTVRQGTRLLNVVCRRDNKKYRVPYFINGQYVDDTNPDVNKAMCDWRTGETIDIWRRLLDFQWQLRQKLGTDEPFFLLSGYRSPATNAMLRKRSKGVAKNSLHMRGMAADLRLQSRSVSQIYRAARSLQLGGVGLYTKSGFVHIDCGGVRTWGA